MSIPLSLATDGVLCSSPSLGMATDGHLCSALIDELLGEAFALGLIAPTLASAGFVSASFLAIGAMVEKASQAAELSLLRSGMADGAVVPLLDSGWISKRTTISVGAISEVLDGMALVASVASVAAIIPALSVAAEITETHHIGLVTQTMPSSGTIKEGA